MGDSITAAEVSGDWIELLRDRFRGTRFVNAGENGSLTWNVRQRLQGAMAQRPDVVVLLVGTNDAAASASPRLFSRLRRTQQLPADYGPTLESFAENIEAIVEDVKSRSTTRTLLIEIPPLGEDRNSAINQRIGAYNSELLRIATREGLTCLPLYDRLLEALPPGHEPRPYKDRTGPIWRANFSHKVLGRSWNEISRRNGLIVLTDWVHLNDRGAAILAALVGEYLDRFEVRPPSKGW